MVSQRNRKFVFRLFQVGALFLLAVVGVFDLHAGMGRGSVLMLAQVLSAVLAAAVWLRGWPSGSTTLPKVAIAAAAVSGALTLAVAASGPTGGDFGVAEAIALLGVLFVLGRRADTAWTVPSIGATLIAAGLLPLRGGTSSEYVIAGLLLALAATAAIGGGVYLRTLTTNRQRAMDAVRAEQRAEFARDLHDFIAHHVTGIVVQAQGARFIAEQDPKRVLLALEQIEQAGAETMASMRRMVGVLRDPRSRPDAPLAPVAGVPDLGPLVAQFNAAGGVESRLYLDGDSTNLPVEVSTSAYRVVMEALTNIRQHAATARIADIWVRRTPDWLLVRVANDGDPPRLTAPRERPGYGLVGLTERVRAVGGRITAGPGIEGGWVVDAAFPIRAAGGH
jgi:signal transduction histidine kinase